LHVPPRTLLTTISCLSHGDLTVRTLASARRDIMRQG
jgi:hypothetical protein